VTRPGDGVSGGRPEFYDAFGVGVANAEGVSHRSPRSQVFERTLGRFIRARKPRLRKYVNRSVNCSARLT